MDPHRNEQLDSGDHVGWKRWRIDIIIYIYNYTILKHHPPYTRYIYIYIYVCVFIKHLVAGDALNLPLMWYLTITRRRTTTWGCSCKGSRTKVSIQALPSTQVDSLWSLNHRNHFLVQIVCRNKPFGNQSYQSWGAKGRYISIRQLPQTNS